MVTAGLYTVTIGVAQRAQAPRIEARYVAAADLVPAAPPSVLPAAPLPPSMPTLITIPSIEVRAPIDSVGLAPDGSIEVPAPGPSYDRPAWYRYSPTPGERGPAVVEGHLDTPSGDPSVFYRLAELGSGAIIEIDRADGRRLTFTVTEVSRHPKANFPTAAVYGDLDHPGLRLLTCGGPLGPDGSYRDNVVVLAVLTAAGPAPTAGGV